MRFGVILLLAASTNAFAIAVLNPGDILRVQFTVANSTCPGGPCDVLTTIPTADGSFFVVPNGGSLYNGFTLLGTHAGTYVPVFRAASSLYSAGAAATVDFSSINDRSINGVVTFSIASGQLVWNGAPSMTLLLARADGPGSSVGVDDSIIITSSEIISAVPEPTTVHLAAAGAALLFLMGRRRIASARRS